MSFKAMMVKLIGWIIGFFSSQRVKRLIFSSSLYSHLKHLEPEEMTDQELLRFAKELDREFRLRAVDPRSTRLGILYHHQIWDSLDESLFLEKQDDTSTYRIASAISVLMAATPTWLRYDIKTMMNDARCILSALKRPSSV